jgi:hypothetical protein
VVRVRAASRPAPRGAAIRAASASRATRRPRAVSRGWPAPIARTRA